MTDIYLDWPPEAHLVNDKYLPGLATWKARLQGSVNRTASGVVMNQSASVSVLGCLILQDFIIIIYYLLLLLLLCSY